MADPPAARAPVVEAAPAPLPTVHAAGVRDDGSAALVARAQRGDRAALTSLLQLHARSIASLCHHVAGPTDAKDAAQESFERIVRELHRFDPARGAFPSWAMTVARNVCRDRLRRRGLERSAFAADGEPHTDAAETQRPDPERIAIAKQGAASLSRALEGLPAPMREAIVMFHVGEARYEEIALALDVPIGTVMTWLHRGRMRLRAALAEQIEEP